MTKTKKQIKQRNKRIRVISISLILFALLLTYANFLFTPQDLGQDGVLVVNHQTEPPKADIIGWINWYIDKKGLSYEDKLLSFKIMSKESGFIETAKGFNKDNNATCYRSIDRGIWQLNDCWYKHISWECAMDYQCATNEAMNIRIKNGDFGQWNTLALIQ